MDYQLIKVYLIGNATRDAAVKTAQESSKKYGDFSLSVSNRDGEPTYYPVRCFGKLAEHVEKIKKGVRLFVEGEVEISTYASEDDQKRMGFRVLCRTYRFLDHRDTEK